MRVSEAGLALLRREREAATEYLVQWNEKWQQYSLVGGKREPGETFRDCCIREVCEELNLRPDQFTVAEEPVGGEDVRYTAMSGSAGVQTEYRVQLFEVEVRGDGWDAAPVNRSVRSEEIEALRTDSGEPISEQVRTVFGICGVFEDFSAAHP